MAVYYSVLEGNWSTNVKTDMGTGVLNTHDYTVQPNPDPADGCQKDFFATYQCGNNPTKKRIELTKEANGKHAVFDCAAETVVCANIKLYITDTGNLILKDNSGKELWQTNNADVAEAVAKSQYTAPNGIFKRPYLEVGEFLEDFSANPTHFIGSPNGKYRLVFLNKTLQVQYEVPGCNDNTPVNPESVELYTTGLFDLTTLGKIGYVEERGFLRNYPDTMTNYTSIYDSIGHYNVLGEDIVAEQAVFDLEACKALCNDLSSCSGIIFNEEASTCQLSNNLNNHRAIDFSKNYNYYVRRKGVMGADESCPSIPSEIKTGNSLNWAEFNNKKSEDMTEGVMCGLKKHTQKERAAVNENRSTLMTFMDTIKSKFNNLIKENKLLDLSKNQLKKKLVNDKNEMNEYINKKDWSGKQLKQLEAMEEDRDLNMISQSYKHMLWSILAILLIIGIIKFTKSSGGSSAAAPAAASAPEISAPSTISTS